MSERIVLLNNPEKADSREQSLIASVQFGQRELFYELVRPYERRVYAAALAILHNEHDAEDAAQEAMLKAFANIGQFRAEARFSTWLIQITVNEALMRRRRERTVPMEGLDRPRSGSGEEEADYVPRDFADWREIPSEALERKEVRQRLANALAKLDRKYREVFVLRDMEHLNIQETAEALGITVASVKTRLLRARLDAARSAGRRMAARLVQPPAVREGNQAMVNHQSVNCEQVWKEISNYVDGDVDAALRSTMDEHFRNCTRCASVLAGTRNAVQLYGDERMLQDVPAGFGRRLEKRLARSSVAGASHWSSWLAWLIPVAAMFLIAGGVLLTNSLTFRNYIQVAACATRKQCSSRLGGGGFRRVEIVSCAGMSLHSRQSLRAHDDGERSHAGWICAVLAMPAAISEDGINGSSR